MAPIRQTKFNLEWLVDEKYRKWLEGDKNSTSAKCKLCNVQIDLSNMGKRALDSHCKSKKHTTRCGEQSKCSLQMSSWAKTPQSLPESSVSAAPELVSTPTIANFFNKEDVSKAEILWTLNTIVTHSSYNSTKHSSALFSVMFPDSEIAKNFSCGSTKCSYLTCFGLAPFFENQLYDKLQKVSYYSLSFDESYNHVTKNEQMDHIIRFFDIEKNIVVSQYLGSQFLGHATADDLLKAYMEATKRLEQNKLIQISMDGPNVNLKFHRDLLALRHSLNESVPTLINIGTCGLHIVHGAFRKGFDSNGWKLDQLLKSLYYLFNESPARRADYAAQTGSTLFPFQFCGTRWVEDSNVAQRAILIWDNVCKYVNILCDGPKNKIPKCTSFTVVKKAVNDSLTIAKLNVFVNVAKLMEPFLVIFQSNSPMTPFMDQEISKLLKSVMERFIKKDILSQSRAMTSLLKIDVEDTTNHIPVKHVVIGFAAKTSLSSLDLSEAKVAEFKSQCLMAYQSIVLKFQRRKNSPCNSELVPYLSSLNPTYMVNHPNNTVVKFEAVLTTLIEKRFLMPAECDEIMKQYKCLINLIKIEKKEEFTEYDLRTDERLDKLFGEMIGMKKEYSEL